MIRAGARPAEPEAPARADCPACQGYGEVSVERCFGRNALEPYVTRGCGVCGGTGTVPAEGVVSCDDCGRSLWVDEGCDHHGATVCRDCALPNCHECADARREAS